ncbi:MAG TPA: hypothetical protein VLA61_01025 [Ideonella sp.]|uniref:hypothetical protein n=1 Tax=Ideonella sp. TaxID=1929293 RepID=UPI002CE2A4E7|nr:hypothetical protein [Ideonella sp.]HSI46833.1 hypothetical protein [Ideonella sp.]
MSNGATAPKPEKEKSESGLSSLMNFVPSAYYDLIARVCPGMAFWVALSFKASLISGVNPKALIEFSGAMLFVLIALSYVSGIVLTGFTVVWDWVSLMCLSTTKMMRKHLGLEAPRSTPFSSRWKAVSLHIDAVVKEDDGAGRVLVKAMAEVTLCQNLLSGLLVLACIGHYSQDQRFFAPLRYMEFYIPIAFALFLSMLFRQAMFLGRVKDLYELYVPEELKFPAAA